MPSRQGDNEFAMNRRPRASGHNQSAICALRECRDGTLDLARIPHVDRAQFHAERRRHGLNCGKLAGSGRHGRITKDHCSR